MINAKEELLKLINGNVSLIVCAEIKHKSDRFMLKVDHSQNELEMFLNSLDFEYDNGFTFYSTNQLFGIVWLKSGAWIERCWDDYSEFWRIKNRPIIPIDLEK